jgi:hypothetical protein
MIPNLRNIHDGLIRTSRISIITFVTKKELQIGLIG